MTRAEKKLDEPKFTGKLNCNGAFITDSLLGSDRYGWARVVVYHFDGEEYIYALEAPGTNSYETAKARLEGHKPLAETQNAFLREVHLDMTMPN